MPTSSWMRFSSSCICLRSLRSREPSGGILEPPDLRQDRGLPAPGGREEAKKLPPADLKEQVVARRDLPETLGHPVEADVDVVQSPALLLLLRWLNNLLHGPTEG